MPLRLPSHMNRWRHNRGLYPRSALDDPYCRPARAGKAKNETSTMGEEAQRSRSLDKGWGDWVWGPHPAHLWAQIA